MVVGNEMVEWLKALATKLDDDPGDNTVEEENQLLQIVLRPPGANSGTHVPSPIVYIHKIDVNN